MPIWWETARGSATSSARCATPRMWRRQSDCQPRQNPLTTASGRATILQSIVQDSVARVGAHPHLAFHHERGGGIAKVLQRLGNGHPGDFMGLNVHPCHHKVTVTIGRRYTGKVIGGLPRSARYPQMAVVAPTHIVRHEVEVDGLANGVVNERGLDKLLIAPQSHPEGLAVP